MMKAFGLPRITPDCTVTVFHWHVFIFVHLDDFCAYQPEYHVDKKSRWIATTSGGFLGNQGINLRPDPIIGCAMEL